MAQSLTKDSSNTGIRLETGAQKILVIQSILVAGVACIYFYHKGVFEAQSALYGGCIALFNVWMTDRWMRTAAAAAAVAPGREVAVFYIGAVQRFVFTLIFFGVGMWVLKLAPLPLLAAFAAAQLGYVFKGPAPAGKT
ncbi:MAG: ATP synthase subunit I [Gammaproteobacteria bacterium]|nr:ATP synthase subunit I [Gammaproteobacteria bacterium]